MKWWGKIGGTAIGYLVGGPVGALVGVVAGHQFDRGMGDARPRRAPGPSSRARYRPRAQTKRNDPVMVTTTFGFMGHLSKASGRVSEAHVDAARRVMTQMDLRPEEIKTAMRLFNSGKVNDFPTNRVLSHFKTAFVHRPVVYRSFVQHQLDALLSVGKLVPSQRNILWQTCQELGITRVEFAQMEARARSYAGHPAADSGDSLAHAYRALGVSRNVSDKELKTAYRRLMNQYHPDKLVSPDVSEEELDAAREKTREVRAAYDSVKEARGLR